MNIYLRNSLHRCVRTAKRNYAAAPDTRSTDSSVTARSRIFEEERTRQLNMVKYTEKITVKHVGTPETCELIMNKYFSTPFNCAQHIQELLAKRSVLALVNGKPWSMHRPLESDCELQFLHFKQDDPKLANDSFWRSCSFVLRYVLDSSFSEKHIVRSLLPGRGASCTSGSFVADAEFGASLGDWNADERELRGLSVVAQRLHHEAHRFEPLNVRLDVARRIFADCPLRTAYLTGRASERSGESDRSADSESDRVQVYRMGEFVDIDDGVLMGDTSQIGLFSVSAIHRLLQTKNAGNESLRRVQGIALPTAFLTHHATFEWLARRAARFNNDVPLPSDAKPPKSLARAK